jgi:hypothetical protein
MSFARWKMPLMGATPDTLMMPVSSCSSFAVEPLKWIHFIHKHSLQPGDLEPGVHAWDEAVAFYSGSQMSPPEARGNLLFDLADNRCTGFNTCGGRGKESEGISHVNHEIFRHFLDGQGKIRRKECDGARLAKEKIVNFMKAPLIQGTIRYAHIIRGEYELGFYDEKHGAEGAAFASAVLPMVHACSPQDAGIILDNMKPRENPEVDFKAVKAAFERNYACMGVKCGQIGGVYDDVLKQYKEDASPCGETFSGLSDQQKQLTLALVFSFAGIVLVGIVVVIVGRLSERRIEEKQLKTSVVEDPETAVPEGSELT